MAPRVRYPPPNLREDFQGTFLHQVLSKAPKFLDIDLDLSFGSAILKKHNDIGDYGEFDDVKDFLQTAAYFEDQADDDSKWESDDIIGAGGFGMVGLWVKKNEAGFEIDKVAIKQTEEPMASVTLDLYDNPVPEEAVIQADLQQKNCRSVLQLRRLKCFRSDAGRRLRYYMEFCPYGDLINMITLYRNYHEDRPDADEQIPEAFLWQLLLRFAELMLKMQEKPFDHPKANDLGDNPYILHLDIKPENVFVSDPEDEDIIKDYPACKLGDWGLATLTSRNDKDNSYEFRDRGTKGWMPLEQYDYGRLGDSWRPRPPWRDELHPDTHVYTTAHTVFAFGMTMFALMTLDDYNAKFQEHLDELDRMRGVVSGVRSSWLDHRDLMTNVLDKPTHYSLLLRTVVTNCLHLDPSQRPSAQEIYDTATDQCNILAAKQNDPQYAADPAFATLRFGKTGRGNFFPSTLTDIPQSSDT